ncbi:MAG: hypothetical protein IT302_00845 [Dehalococcoidia bacterium]|nr:hypothetical protein [Dehalococcoidia bacterium]
MSYFVLVYSRNRGELLRAIEVFDDSHRMDALQRRFELEREYPGEEVVVLGAESEEAIRETHGRYFYTEVQLLDRLAAELARNFARA